WCLLCLALLGVGAWAAEGDQLRATADKPATVTVDRPAAKGAIGNETPQVILNVAAYKRPASSGPVQIIVKAADAAGVEREVHGFGLLLSKPANVSFPLPKDLADSDQLKLRVYLCSSSDDDCPGKADAKAAKLEGVQLEIGGAELRWGK